jgi:hypothetical protein
VKHRNSSDWRKILLVVALGVFMVAPQTLASDNWQYFEEIAESGTVLEVKTNAAQLKLGEPLKITVDVPTAGYLNVVAIGPDDAPSVLFPNSYHQDNAVLPLPLVIPTPKMPFELRATPPIGKVLLVAVLTTEPVNLFEQLGGDTSGQRAFEALKVLQTAVLNRKSLRSSLYTGQAVVEVCEFDCAP